MKVVGTFFSLWKAQGAQMIKKKSAMKAVSPTGVFMATVIDSVQVYLVNMYRTEL